MNIINRIRQTYGRQTDTTFSLLTHSKPFVLMSNNLDLTIPSVYVCMYVCMYVYMYVCMYVYMYICMYVCMYVYMYVCIYVYMYVCMYICMYVCMYICIYVCMYVHVHRNLIFIIYLHA